MCTSHIHCCRFDCIVGREPDLAAMKFDMDFIVANYFMASRQRHPFYKFVFERFLKAEFKENVLYATGPMFLTQSLVDYAKQQQCQQPNLTVLYEDREAFNFCGCALLPWRYVRTYGNSRNIIVYSYVASLYLYY